MKANKAYKFRLYPNAEQQMMFAKTFGCARFVYNKMLAEKISWIVEDEEAPRAVFCGIFERSQNG